MVTAMMPSIYSTPRQNLSAFCTHSAVSVVAVASFIPHAPGRTQVQCLSFPFSYSNIDFLSVCVCTCVRMCMWLRMRPGMGEQMVRTLHDSRAQVCCNAT
jgi:hypothetical protein